MRIVRNSRRCFVWCVLVNGCKNGRLSEYRKPPFNCTLPTARFDQPALKTRAWKVLSFFLKAPGFFGLELCSVAPEEAGLVHALYSPLDDSPRTHKKTRLSPKDLQEASTAVNMAASRRLRYQNSFGGTRANTLRPRSAARAQTCTGIPTRKSAFLADQHQKPGSSRRRAPGAHQRDRCHTRILRVARVRFRSLRRTHH